MKHTIKIISLKNGIKGILIDVPDATVMSIDLNFRAGDFLSPSGKWETAHVLEHMVLGANKEFDRSRAFQAEFQKNGAYMNASTGAHDLNYMVECADFEWERILGLFKLSIESPLLSDDEFKAEMGNVREELTGDLNHNFRQILIKARQKFGLVALSDTERLQQMDNLSVEDVRAYYKKTHLLENALFIIAGNVLSREDKIIEIFENIELDSGERFELPDEVPEKFDKVFYLDKPDLENIYFFLTTYTNRVLSPREDDALGLVNTMLTATMQSLILGEARERGLAYDISSSFTKIKGATGWWFGAELMPQNAVPVFDIIKKELGNLLKGELDEKELEAAKQYSLGRFQRSAQTVRGLAGGYSHGYFFDERVDDFYAFPERIKKVTKQDIIDVVASLFDEDCWGLSIMGTDKDELAKTLNHQIAPLWNK